MQSQSCTRLDTTRFSRKRPPTDAALSCGTSEAPVGHASSLMKKRNAQGDFSENPSLEHSHQPQQTGRVANDAPQVSDSIAEQLNNLYTPSSRINISEPQTCWEPNATEDTLDHRADAFRGNGVGLYSTDVPAITSLLQDVIQLHQDGQELLQQLHNRVRSTATELRVSLSEIDKRLHTHETSREDCEEEAHSGEHRQCDQWPQQLLLEDEIATCRQILDDMNHNLSRISEDLQEQSLLREGARSSAEEADILVPNKSFIDSLASRTLQPAFSLVKEVKRLMTSIVERINCVESGSSLWCTHAKEVLEYLQHLQHSFTELESKRRETERRLNDLRTSIAGKRKHVDQVKCRLERMQQHYHLASIDINNDNMFQASNKMDILERRREALERELKSLAAFSPLFIVERTAKYITLQYRPEGSTIDHEISIEGLDVSLSKGSSRLSPFFSVHINPPNEAVSSLLENQIKQLMNRLIASQKSNASEQGEVSGVASSLEQGEAGADDAVVKHIASILIKTLSSAFSAAESPSPYFPYRFAEVAS